MRAALLIFKILQQRCFIFFLAVCIVCQCFQMYFAISWRRPLGFPSVVDNFAQVSLGNFICWQFKKTSHVGGTSRKELVKVSLSNFPHIAIKLFMKQDFEEQLIFLSSINLYNYQRQAVYISHLSHFKIIFYIFLSFFRYVSSSASSSLCSGNCMSKQLVWSSQTDIIF